MIPMSFLNGIKTERRKTEKKNCMTLSSKFARWLKTNEKIIMVLKTTVFSSLQQILTFSLTATLVPMSMLGCLH